MGDQHAGLAFSGHLRQKPEDSFPGSPVTIEEMIPGLRTP